MIKKDRLFTKYKGPLGRALIILFPSKYDHYVVAICPTCHASASGEFINRCPTCFAYPCDWQFQVWVYEKRIGRPMADVIVFEGKEARSIRQEVSSYIALLDCMNHDVYWFAPYLQEALSAARGLLDSELPLNEHEEALISDALSVTDGWLKTTVVKE